MSEKEHFYFDVPSFEEFVIQTSDSHCEGRKFILETVQYFESLGRFSLALKQIDLEVDLGHLTKLEADLLRFNLTYETALSVGIQLDEALQSDFLLLEGDQLVEYTNYLRSVWDGAGDFVHTRKSDVELCSPNSEALSEDSGNDF